MDHARVIALDDAANNTYLVSQFQKPNTIFLKFSRVVHTHILEHCTLPPLLQLEQIINHYCVNYIILLVLPQIVTGVIDWPTDNLC